jgi:hypothetical protein
MAKPAAGEPPLPVTNTFEPDVARIKEKGKDLKGDQRIFYQSRRVIRVYAVDARALYQHNLPLFRVNSH